MSRVRALAAAAAVLLTFPLWVVPAHSASSRPVSFPKNPVGIAASVVLPSELDPAAPYLPQVACQPGTMPGLAKLQELVLSTYGVGGRGNTARGCTEGVSEHSDGRAWDWMVDTKKPAEKKAAADFLAWLTADDGLNARRLGVMYVIYNQKIWAVYRSKEGWRKSYGHTDHIHISLSWNGARGTTSFWTGQVHPTDFGPCVRFAGQPGILRAKPRLKRCYSPVALVKKTTHKVAELGAKSNQVKTAQRLLGVTQTGTFDSATYAAVRAYQKAHDLPVTAGLDAPTWASLRPKKIKKNVVKGYSARKAARFGYSHYAAKTFKKGAAGKRVLMLQRALKMPLADQNGYFGRQTVAALKSLQGERNLPVTGKASRLEWKALTQPPPNTP